MAIKWNEEKEEKGIKWDAESLSRSKSTLSASQNLLEGIVKASNFVNQTVGKPFIDIAATPLQAGAKALGIEDPFSEGGPGGADVAPLEQPLRKAGSAGELASYAFPFGKVASGMASLAKPLLGRAAGLFGKTSSGAAAGYGVDVSMDLAGGETDAGEVLKPGVATAIGGALPPLGALGGAVRNSVPKLLSYTSEVPEEAFSMMLQRRAPVMSAVQSGMTPEQSLQVSQQAVRGLRKKLSAEWDESSQAIYDEFADKSILFSGSLERKLQNIAEEFSLDLPQNLKNVSAKESMDLLKKINELPRGILAFSPKGAVVREVKEGIREKAIETFGGKKGSLATLYANYSTKRNIFDAANDVVKAYSTGKPIQQSTALGRLMSVFNENKSAYLDAIIDLEKETGSDLLSSVIATKISPMLPSASSAMSASGTFNATKSLTDKALNLLLLPLTSPRSAAFIARVADRMKIPTIQRTPGDEILDRSKQIIQEQGSEGGFVRIPKAKGGTPKDALTLKSLTRMAEEVKTPTVSRKYIEDLSNRPDIKQPERDLLRKTLEDEGDIVDVKSFANKVKTELLPLKIRGGGSSDFKSMTDYQYPAKYENITLPDELRGPVANYSEHIYESPIKTSAGQVHYFDSDSYFAHTRIEDLPTSENVTMGSGGPLGTTVPRESTRRVIELQTDLFQKGRLENEASTDFNITNDVIERAQKRLKEIEAEIKIANAPRTYDAQKAEALSRENMKLTEALSNERRIASKERISPLEPYRNDWWPRIIREEVKQAAKDGKTKLQFPTGETAMKIEGLGETQAGARHFAGPDKDGFSKDLGELKPDNLKVGAEYIDSPVFYDEGIDGTRWIITDVLGDGKFKAVQKRYVDLGAKNWKYMIDNSEVAGGGNPAWMAENTVTGERDFVSFTPANKDKALAHLKSKVDDKPLSELGERYGETFDISGKVDTNNPIYKFYEKDVQRYLTNKYKGKVITDPQGVKWVEIDVPKEAAKLPIEAFGVGAVTLPGDSGIFEIERGEKTSFTPVQEEIESKINDLRSSQGLPALSASEELSVYAQKRADEMARTGNFSHYSEGDTEMVAVKRDFDSFQGTEYVYENIAWGEDGFSDSTTTANTWKDSKSGHRDTLLNPNLTEFGTGVARGKYRGKDVFFIAQIYSVPQVRVSDATITRGSILDENEKTIMSLRVLPIKPLDTKMANSTPSVLPK